MHQGAEIEFLYKMAAFHDAQGWGTLAVSTLPWHLALW
jgi:hypothetical protein